MVDSVHPALSDGSALLLVMSGKMGSGKDVLAPLVMAKLKYAHNAKHMYYADALKNEINILIDAVRNNESIQKIMQRTNTTLSQTEHLVSLLDNISETTHSRERTPEMRAILQYWGTEVRRKANEDYWVNITRTEVVNTLDKGQSVFITDARFPNEIVSMSSIGAYTVRLDITEEIQRQRLMERDGLLPSHEATSHSSENMLDSYSDFSLRFANHSTIANAVDLIAAGYKTYR